MHAITVHDHVRDVDLVVDVPEDATAAVVREAAIVAGGLPRRSFEGAALTYQLHASDGPALDATARVPPGGPDVALHLRSDDAGPVWAELVARAEALRAEVQSAARGVADAAQAEVHASLERIRDSAADQARSLVREATVGLEQQVLGRIEGVGRRLRRRLRRRIAAQVDAIRVTGALPEETRLLSMAVGQLTALARAAVAVPLAGTALVVGTVGTGTAVVVASDDSAQQIADLRKEVEGLGTKVEGLEAEVDGVGGQLVRHAEDDVDPHGIAPLDTVGAFVLGELDQPGEVAAWVQALLANAEDLAGERTDRTFSTSYATIGDPVVVAAGETLWAVADRVLGDAELLADCPGVVADESPSAAAIGALVARLWLHNVGVVGASPDLVEPGTRLQVVCPAA